MKHIVTTGKIYLTYMAGVWGYYFLYHNQNDITRKTIQYWKNNVLSN
jgi:hypothetical protein